MAKRIGAKQMRIAREMARDTSRYFNHATVRTEGTTIEAIFQATLEIAGDKRVTLTSEVHADGQRWYLIEVGERGPHKARSV